MEAFKRQQIPLPANTALPSQHQQQAADNRNDLGNSENSNNKHSVPSLFRHNNQHQRVASPPNKSPVVCTNNNLVSNKSANEEEANVNHLDATSSKSMAAEQRTMELSSKAGSIGYKANTEPQREAINQLSHTNNQSQEQQQQLLDVNKTMNISTKQSSSNNHRATTAKAANAEFSVENSSKPNFS